LLNIENGIETADLIPNANLVIIEGMAHELPAGAWPQILAAIVDTVDRAEPRQR
jgi:hypothetical protein